MMYAYYVFITVTKLRYRYCRHSMNEFLYISFSHAFGERNSVDFHQLWPVWNLWWLTSSADCIDNISVHAAVCQTQVPRMENTKNAQGQCDSQLGYETIHEMVVLIALASNEGSAESVHLHILA